MTPPTIRQVAAAAGVSRATTSRVLTGDGYVSAQARAAVTAAVEQLGYVPNQVARNLARGRTGSIALVVPEPNTRVLSDPFFGETIVALSAFLEERDLQMVLLVARGGGQTDRIRRYLAGGHVDGAVVTSHHRDDALNRGLAESPLPCVFIGRPLGVTDHVYVDLDNHAGARLATEHLLAAGRRRLATVAGPTDMVAGVDRLAGWRLALARAGLPTDAVAHGDFTEAGGAEAMARLLQRHPDLDAVFVASDLMAAGALRTLKAHGRAVPDDVAVIGYDDIAIAETTRPSLTTVAQPVAAMTQRAGAVLLDLIAAHDRGGAASPRQADPVLFRPELVLRDSTP